MLLKIFVIFISFKGISSHPSGGGTTACMNLIPSHGGILPQESEMPVNVNLNIEDSVINAGQLITFTLQGQQNFFFRGFMIQARLMTDEGTVVGSFELTNGMRHVNCQTLPPQSVATHTDNADRLSATLTWRAPTGFTEDFLIVSFHYSIVQTTPVFWVNGVSRPILIDRDDSATDIPISSPSPIPPPVTPPVDFPSPYEGCDDRKVCMGVPNNCIASENCGMFGAVFIENERFVFELFGTPEGQSSLSYIAFALSDDNRMGRDSVIECVNQNSAIRGFTSFTVRGNDPGSPRINNQEKIRFLRGQVVDGKIHCFVERRDNVTTIEGMRFDLVNKKHYLLLAKGFELRGLESIGHHLEHAAYSDSSVLLTNPGIVSAGGARPLTIAHGALMTIAWIGSTTIGIFLAKYFKRTWNGQKVCGQDVWFFWHVFCQILTFLLTISAVIIIFVDVGEWRTSTHSILGIIVVSLCVIQPIVAVFRPKPNKSSRPVFNFLHKFFGNVTHLLAFFTIYFAVRLPAADLVDWTIYIIIAFVAFYTLMHLVFGIIQVFAEVEGRKIEKIHDNHQTNSEPYSLAKKTIFAFFVLTVLLFVIALVLLVSFPSPN